MTPTLEFCNSGLCIEYLQDALYAIIYHVNCLKMDNHSNKTHNDCFLHNFHERKFFSRNIIVHQVGLVI